MLVRLCLTTAAAVGLALVLGTAAEAASGTGLRDDPMPAWVAALIIGAVVGLPVVIGLGIYFGGGPVDPASLPSSGGSASSEDALAALQQRRQDQRERHDLHDHGAS